MVDGFARFSTMVKGPPLPVKIRLRAVGTTKYDRPPLMSGLAQSVEGPGRGAAVSDCKLLLS